jgi:hypothetical protein
MEVRVSQPPTYKTRKSDVNNSTQKAYRQFVKETGRSDISFDVFSKVPALIHEKAINKLFSGHYAIKIPKFGTLRLLKVDPYRDLSLRIDWGRYRKTGEWATHRNTHTNGKMYKVHFYFYQKKHVPLTFFKFSLAVKHQRALAQKIKNNELLR